MRKEYYSVPSSRVWIERDDILEKVTNEKKVLESTPLIFLPCDSTARAYIKGRIDSLKWVENQLIQYGKVAEE